MGGGQVKYLPFRRASLLYYNAYYNSTSSMTLDSINYLFRKGVDEGVKLLLSNGTFNVDADADEGGGMSMVVPKPAQYVSQEDYKKLSAKWELSNKDTTFWSIATSGSFFQSR